MLKLKEREKVECNACGQAMEYGAEGVQVQHIICGPRGLIPLGQAFVFCCDSCHEQYFEISDPSTGNRGEENLP